MSKVFAAGILGILGWLAFLSRKESGEIGLRMGLYLYKKACTMPVLKKMLRKGEQQVVKHLISLHPGDSPAQLLTAYYVEKMRLMVWVLFVGSVFVVGMGMAKETSEVVVENGKVHRGRETETILLEARVQATEGVVREAVSLEVEPRVLLRNEADALYEEFVGILETLMQGENPSLLEVRENLYLPDELEGYPFLIQWSSTIPALVGNDGHVQNETLDGEQELFLRAEVQYDAWEWKQSWEITVLPPIRSEEDQLVYDLKKHSNAAVEESRNAEMFLLPANIDGRVVQWKRVTQDTGWFLLGLTFLAAAAVYGLKDWDVRKDLEKRKACMREAYPEMVSKYALLLGAGMTVRGAFQKICSDYYDKYTEREGSVHPLYEEMLYACNELRAGVSESKVYENFGLRTGVTEYTRLCTLLSQNLKKGNATLVQRLRTEYEDALQEGCRIRKKRGEEAGTRLLVPMVMMLLMVLLMIMLPAFAGLVG